MSRSENNRQSRTMLVGPGKPDRTVSPARLCSLLILLCVCLSTLLPTQPAAAMPVAGTVISNQARALYVSDDNDHWYNQESNWVSLVVQPREALLLQSSQQIAATPGSAVYLPHRLINSGNTRTSYAVTLGIIAGSFTLSSTVIYRDTNGNGTVDSNEPLFGPTDHVTLNPGESADFVIFGIIPALAPLGSSGAVRITGTSTIQGATATNEDAILISNIASIALVKTASATSAAAGGEITYTITASNGSNAPALPVSSLESNLILLDGAPASVILVRDVVPANADFVPGSLKLVGTGRLIYHKSGDPKGSFLTVEPAVVDEVGLATDSFPAAGRVTLNFNVKIHTNFAGTMHNTSYTYYDNGDHIGSTVQASNQVETTVTGPPITITFCQYSDRSQEENPVTNPAAACKQVVAVPFDAASSGSKIIYIEASAPRCNNDPEKPDTRTITVTSSLTGDVEEYPALESGNNTGIFRILPKVPLTDGSLLVTHHNGIVEALRNDRLTAEISGCGSGSVTTELFIDPSGVVFDSRTNETIAGATVTLKKYAGSPGGDRNDAANYVDAVVYDYDLNPIKNFTVTGMNGKFEFPLIEEGEYRFFVSPPNGYVFPSVFPPAMMPPRTIVDASYGKTFLITKQTGAVTIDLPVDPSAASGLFVEKKASAQIAEPADFVDYHIKVRNMSGKVLKSTELHDVLPFGFSYEPGSTRISSGLTSPTPAADPEGGRGPRLTFKLHNMAIGQEITVVYRLKVGPAALQGDGINRAQAIAAYGTESNVASAQVKVQGGVFSDKAFIFGKVFVDCNRDRIQGPEELGIPGVRLYLEDGTYVITDTEGKFSLYGITPRTHILKLDPTTMPEGSELIDLNNRNAGDAGSRFIDLKKSELHKANFAEGSCTDEILQQVKARRAQGQVFAAEDDQRLKTRLSVDPIIPLADPKGQPASGLLGGYTRVPTFTTTPSVTVPDAAEQKQGASSSPPRKQELEELIKEADNAPAFLNLTDGMVLPINQTPIMMKGRAGSTLKLMVNGTEIGEKAAGKIITRKDGDVEAREYIGINLLEGKNDLQITQHDPFGNLRGKAVISVIAPGSLKKISIEIPDRTFPADGHTPVPVLIKLTDGNGVPVKSRTQLTIESLTGRWQVKDLNPQEPGIQTFIEGGSMEYLMLPPLEAGEEKIQVSSGILKAETTVSFVPDLRPIIAAGIVEGTIHLREGGFKGILPAHSGDGFDQELTAFAAETGDGKAGAAGRAALFLKGKIKGDYLLTMAYDSDKDKKERLFRDIQPDEFYSVYGDSSIRGFDAQSTGKLYLRVDKNRSYILYGDFTTPSSGEVRQLGAYSRSLNGVRGHHEVGAVTVNTFASQDSTRQIVEEIPAGGISGPYYLQKGPVILNSEKIEIIVRDQDQPSLIKKSTPQTRFTDYEIDQFTGRVIFKAPISQFDPNPSFKGDLDPQIIRITYEAEQGGKSFWVYGADAQVRINKRLEAGGAYIRDDNPKDRVSLMSANSTFKLTEKTLLLGEWAQTQHDLTGAGNGARVELRHDDGPLKGRVQVTRTDTAFDNPSAPAAKGRFEASGNMDYRFTGGDVVKGEALHSEDLTTGGTRDGFSLSIEHPISETFRAEFGVRHTSETATPAISGSTASALNLNTVRAKVSGQVPSLPKISLFADYEQAVDTFEKKAVGVGGEYKFVERGRFYARHQLISSLSGPYGLNNTQQQNATLIGIDSDYMKDGRLFSEYRIRDAVAGRDSEAAIGLKNAWPIAPGLRLQTGLEQVKTITGVTDNSSTAVTGAVDYTPSPLWKSSASLEARRATASNTYLSTMGVAHKYSRNITLLGRQVLAITDSKGHKSDKFQERFQIGFAYRPVDTDKWNLLGKYEYKQEKTEGQEFGDINRKVNILSGHLNYQPTKAYTFYGAYAGKLTSDESNGLSSRANAHMLRGRLLRDLTEQWDVGITGGALFSNYLQSVQYGIGAEVGYLVAANLWMSTGYNFFGYKDDDLGAEEFTNQGVYLRLRFKFDEDLFAGSDPHANKTIVPATGSQATAPAQPKGEDIVKAKTLDGFKRQSGLEKLAVEQKTATRDAIEQAEKELRHVLLQPVSFDTSPRMPWLATTDQVRSSLMKATFRSMEAEHAEAAAQRIKSEEEERLAQWASLIPENPFPFSTTCTTRWDQECGQGPNNVLQRKTDAL